MIRSIDAPRDGDELEADAVIVGSGPGGAVAAANLSRAGLKTIVLEAGKEVRPEDMEVDAPTFLARTYWDGGLRFVGGTAPIPSMQGRCVGGSSVVNSAIMMRLPQWVRDEWANQQGLAFLRERAVDESYDRIFARSNVAPTAHAVLGRRNLAVRDALFAVGLGGEALPRAVKDCEGRGECVTGCRAGRKLSVDRTWLRDAVAAGADVRASATAERILIEGGRAAGVAGAIVDRQGSRPSGRFVVRAPRVVLAAGAMNTPALLRASGILARGRVGASFLAHIGTGVMGFMHDRVDPWFGATQGWGAMSNDLCGVKFESLWASPSLILMRLGGVGTSFMRALEDVRFATIIAVVVRVEMRGRVRVRRDGSPLAMLRIPERETKKVLCGVELACTGLLRAGARWVSTGIHGVPERIRSEAEARAVGAARVRLRDLPMTSNHIFGSCPMHRDVERGAVDAWGRVHDVEGLFVADASLFPTPSAVNPQATVMMLSDRVSRRIADLEW